MSTQCFLWSRTDGDARFGQQYGAGYATFEQGDRNFGTERARHLDSSSRDAGPVQSGGTAASVAGPTAGRELATTGNSPVLWMLAPLSAAVTISGTITINIWASETSMNDNCALNVRVFKVGPDGTVTQIVKTARTTELGTTIAVQNFTATPTSTACAIGDRIGIVVFADDAGTMASGVGMSIDVAAASAGVDGDSYVTFTENLSFFSLPSGTTVYPTTTSAGINPGSANEYEAWTSRGAGSTNAVTNTAAGPTSKIQCTETAGGTALEWYTKPLQAVTLSGLVLVNLWGLESSTLNNAQFICEVARTDGDGTNATVWGLAGPGGFLPTSAAAQSQFCIAGDNLSITDGQRIRIRVFIDDAVGQTSQYTLASMASGGTATLQYAGTSAAAAGDSWLQFPVMLSEFTAAAQVPYFNLYPPLLAQ